MGTEYRERAARDRSAIRVEARHAAIRVVPPVRGVTAEGDAEPPTCGSCERPVLACHPAPAAQLVTRPLTMIKKWLPFRFPSTSQTDRIISQRRSQVLPARFS